jgi:hypothetical protein
MPGFLGVGIAGVELVGAHDAADHVAVAVTASKLAMLEKKRAMSSSISAP